MTIATATTAPPKEQRWVFFGEGALPANPVARDHEKRGRRWLMVSYLFCPCHIPLTLATIGAALSGNALRVGIALTVIYALVLWRGFRQIRRAKQIEAAGGTLTCTPRGCDITTPTSLDAGDPRPRYAREWSADAGRRATRPSPALTTSTTGARSCTSTTGERSCTSTAASRPASPAPSPNRTRPGPVG